MLTCCKDEISTLIKKSDFFTIQCDETTDITNWYQMVLICRYVYDERVCENFWCFKRVTDKTAEVLQKSIEEEINFLNKETPEKWIAQTYDGANVTSGQKNGVQHQMKEKYPYAH
nr:unnamed protein product [Callosobruchus chinensis]